MTKQIALSLAIGLAGIFGFAVPGWAADHLATGTAAGGLTESSQPFQNGTNNLGRSGESVPGQGSPLSGEDRTTPATDTLNSGQVHSNPAAESGKTAPSSNSVHK